MLHRMVARLRSGTFGPGVATAVRKIRRMSDDEERESTGCEKGVDLLV